MSKLRGQVDPPKPKKHLKLFLLSRSGFRTGDPNGVSEKTTSVPHIARNSFKNVLMHAYLMPTILLNVAGHFHRLKIPARVK